MTPNYPFWFKQRQCKAEPVGENGTLKVTGPNLGEAYLGVTLTENNRYRAFLKSAPDGPDTATTADEIGDPNDAWEAAFELYRTHVIV